MRKEQKMSNKFYAVCGIVEIDGKLLFVRHTYGSAKDRILLPGGYVKENELPTDAIAREIFEETGVKAAAKNVIAVEFKADQWCVFFSMEYISGTPHSDHHENSEVLLLTAVEAIARDDITNLSREILTAYKDGGFPCLEKSHYVPRSADKNSYALYGML